MKLGIVGLPNVGKSTLFNAITKAGAESANYPFCTIEPNVGELSSMKIITMQKKRGSTLSPEGITKPKPSESTSCAQSLKKTIHILVLQFFS